MFDLLHVFATKVAIIFVSVGAAIGLISAPSTAPVALPVQETAMVQSTTTPVETDLSDVEQLRKEIKELKSKPASIVDTASKPASSPSSSLVPIQTPQKPPVQGATLPPAPKAMATEDNFREAAIPIYKETAEFFKRAIEETRNTDIPPLKLRRSKLMIRANLIRSDLFINPNSPAWLNEVFDLYAQEHEREIKFIDETLEYIEANLTSMSAYQAEYDRNASSLLADSKRIVTRAELIRLAEHERNFVDTKYRGLENITSALKNFYQTVIRQEDRYAEEYATIKNGLAKLTEPTKASAPIYQPMPQSDLGLTARQQLMLNPITCTVNRDPIQTTVTCY